MKLALTPPVSDTNWQRYLLHLAALTILYALAGYLASLLSMPPAYGSPVWPASGVALAGLLLGGWRLWPAIAIGYLSVHSVLHGFGLNAVLLGTGPVLQALFGCWSVHRVGKGIASVADAGILRGMLLAGPIACSISPTLGVAVLTLQGALPLENYAADWVMWWVGDTLGVLLVAPLALVALPAGRRLLRGRLAQIAVPLIGAAALLLPSMYWFHDNEEQDAREPLALQADLSYDVTRERLQAASKAIIVAARYYSVSTDVSSGEFDSFVIQMLNDGIFGLGWLPRVAHADREGFERMVRQDPGFADFRIAERGPGGELEVAGERAEYFPLRFVRTRNGDTRSRGFDAASDEILSEAIERARRSGEPAATAPFSLIASDIRTVLLFVPVYPRSVDPATLIDAERHATVDGFIVGVLDLPMITDAFTTTALRRDIDFRIRDRDSQADDALVATAEAAGIAPVSLWSRGLSLYGRNWQVEAQTAADYWLAGKSTKSKFFLLATLLSVFLISVHTVSAAARNRAAGLKVAARTRELADSRRRLSAALSISQVAVWEVDVARDLLTLDDKAFAQLRTTARAEGGSTFSALEWVQRFVHPDDAQPLLAAYGAAIRNNPDARSISPEFRIIGGDGEVRHLVLHIESEVDESGKATRVFGSTQDITELKRTEVALRESEEYSRSVIQASDDCIMVLSLDGRLLEMAARGREILGVDNFDDVRDRPYDSFWERPEDIGAASNAVITAAAGGKARFTGFTSTLRGSQKWFDVSITPISGPNGRPVRLLVVSRDISDEYEAKEEIRRINAGLESEIERRSLELATSERELRAIFDVAAIGIAHISLDKKMLRVNPKLCEISGFSEEEFLATNHLGRSNPDDADKELELIERIVSGEADTYTIEKRYRRKDEVEIWVRVTGSVVRDAHGTPLYRVAIIEDINESHAERENRIASERRYRELFDRNPMPMWTYDSDTLRFTSVNDAAIRHYGYSRDEFLSMKLQDIRSPDQLPELEKALQSRTFGYSPAHEICHRKKDGTLITAEITAHDILNDGKPARLVLANDVTERKRADKLLAGQKRVLESIAADTPVNESLEVVARLAEEDSPGLLCSLLLMDPQTGQLRHATAPSLPPDFVRAIDGGMLWGDGEFFSTISTSEDAVVVADIASNPLWHDASDVAVEHDLHACWSMPIRGTDGKVLGAFVIYYNEIRQPLEAETRVIETLVHTAAIAINKDIETRKLRRSQDRFKATFEMGGLGIAHVGLDGRVMRANNALCQIIGYSEDELRQINPDALIHPDDREVRSDLRRKLWSGEIPRYTAERRYLCKDGSQVWVRVTASTVLNEHGDVDYAIALLEDISWRKQAEASLHRQQEINRLLLENLTEGVVACDENGELMLFNKAARDWHGADARDLSKEQQAEYFTLLDADGVMPLADEEVPLMRAFRGEPVIDQEMSIVRRGHAPRTVLASGAQLRDADGAKRGAVVVLHDVTERRESLAQLERAADELRAANAAVEHERASLAQRVAERTTELTTANEQLENARKAAEAASRAKSAFLAVMSHEIRTPMNGIVGMVEVLGQSELAGEQIDAVNTIRDSSFSLLRIIDDILDFSKIEAGRLELEQVGVDLPELAGNVCDALAAEALSKDVDLRLFVDPSLPRDVTADPTRLRQLLYNLIGNAIKFSSGLGDRRGRVKLAVEMDVKKPGCISFRVSDNGIGIATEILPELFTSFTQAEASTTRRFGGTGLGLAITKRLVNLMGGSIDVSSAPGEGADFRVSLPLPPIGDALATPGIVLDGLVGILVDTPDGDNHAVERYLQNAQATVHRVASIDAAVQLARRSQDPAVVILHTGENLPDSAQLPPPLDGDKLRYLVVCRGSRAAARIAAPHVVMLRGSAIRAQEYLHAVAVAAGRESPDVSSSGDEELVRGQLVVPTVTQARADGRLILVAEDDPINQKVILRQLGLLGYAGEVASNGVEALQMWREGTYALLLTDLHMPDMDGYRLVEKIRELETDDERMPVLALTANALRGEAERATAAGFDEYLTKPLQLSVLGAILERWLPAVRGDNDADYRAAADATSETGAAIDRGVLQSIVGNDEELIREFLSEYLVASRLLTRELREAMADGALRDVATLAHRQKGAARAVGASRLGDVCAELENAARAAETRMVYRLISRYEASAASVDAEISELLGNTGIAA